MISDAPLQHDGQSDDRKLILVVDDDPLFRSLMVSVLRHDFTVAVAADGADAFYLAMDNIPDAAVFDIQMPGWDGIKTLKAFRAHPQLQKVRVIVLTSDASRETVLAAIHAGADDYIIKTAFSRDEFRSKLDQLLLGTRIIAEPLPELAAVTPMMPLRDDLESNSHIPDPNTFLDKRPDWVGTEDLLQEAIDAWE